MSRVVFRVQKDLNCITQAPGDLSTAAVATSFVTTGPCPVATTAPLAVAADTPPAAAAAAVAPQLQRQSAMSAGDAEFACGGTFVTWVHNGQPAVVLHSCRSSVIDVESRAISNTGKRNPWLNMCPVGDKDSH